MSVVRAFLLGASAHLSLSSVFCLVCSLGRLACSLFLKKKNSVPRINDSSSCDTFTQ